MKEKAEVIFNLYDFDKSKVITQDEFVILLKTTLTSLNAMGNKSPPSLQEVEEKTLDIINKWDTNNDGCISINEFISFLSKDQDILRTLSQAGLITPEDLRIDFGGEGEYPDCDSDLEEEIRLL